MDQFIKMGNMWINLNNIISIQKMGDQWEFITNNPQNVRLVAVQDRNDMTMDAMFGRITALEQYLLRNNPIMIPEIAKKMKIADKNAEYEAKKNESKKE